MFISRGTIDFISRDPKPAHQIYFYMVYINFVVCSTQNHFFMFLYATISLSLCDDLLSFVIASLDCDCVKK